MDVKEFKQKYPERAHLEGDALWNAMEDVMLSDGEFHEYTNQNRERIRFPWTPENGDGIPIGIWDVVRNEDIDSKTEWKEPTSTPQFIIFDIGDETKQEFESDQTK